MLGGQLMKVFGGGATGWDRGDCDVTQAESLKLKVKSLRPRAIINCVAYNDVDGAESHRELAFTLNAEVVKNLSAIANQLNIPLAHFSSNYVFDGEKGEYKEDDQPNPLSAYGQSKYQGEQNLIANCKKYYLIRTSVLFGPKGQSELAKKSFVDLMLELSQKTATIKAINDETNSLTYAPDLALAVKNLIADGKPYGIYHLVNSGQASWFELAREIFSIAGKKITVEPVPSTAFPRTASRPKKSALINTKLDPLRPWQEALKEFLI